MFKWFASSLALTTLLAAVPAIHAQSVPTATRDGGGIQVGVGALYLNPDYNDAKGNDLGFSIFADYDFSKHIGVEADAHLAGVISPGDITEHTYVVGPRFTYTKHKITGYAKVVFGIGDIQNQNNPDNVTYFNPANQSQSFFIYGLGGGLEYRLKRHLSIRAIDFEVQKWGNFEPHTLSPYAITVGLAYVIK